MDNHLPVLIVGAGPTGLMMACELARRNIAFRIIDKKPERTLTSNAVGIQPRTLELLDQIGIVDRFLKAGHFCNAIHLYIKGKSIGRIPLNQIDSPYQFALVLPQSETERLLTERLAEFNKEVDRPLELVTLKKENNHTIATMKDSAGNTETITCDWLFGSDGANSMVRQQCDIAFPGEDISDQFVVADASMDSFESNTEIHVFFDTGTVFATFALGSNKYRIGANIHQNAPRKIFTEKEIKEIVNERSYGSYSVNSISWISPFWIHSRIVKRMRDGAAFLAGDAAHIHSPVGGQGMNTGIQDAYNLAWKLALVIKGQAKPSLLDSYQSERYPVVKKIVDRTERFTKAGLFENPFLIKLRNMIFRILFHQPKLLKKISMMLTQLSFQYKNSPIIDFHQKINRKSPLPGKRAPDVIITANARLYDYFRNGTQHNILLFTGTAMKNETISTVKGLKLALNKAFPELVKVYVVAKDKLADIDNVIVDEHYKLHKRYNIKNPAIYIIRPDNYIAYCSENLDGNIAERFLRTYLL